VKLWRRGTELSSARTVFEGKSEDVASTGASEILSDGRYDLITRTPAFYRHESFLLLGDRPVKLDLPEDSQPRAFFHDRLLFSLRSDCTAGGKTYRAGSLLSTGIDDLLRGVRRSMLFAPGEWVRWRGRAHARPRVIQTRQRAAASRRFPSTAARGSGPRCRRRGSARRH
jgi:prolyl oligopeptidase